MNPTWPDAALELGYESHPARRPNMSESHRAGLWLSSGLVPATVPVSRTSLVSMQVPEPLGFGLV